MQLHASRLAKASELEVLERLDFVSTVEASGVSAWRSMGCQTSKASEPKWGEVRGDMRLPL
ncbi:MAG TPA: hypothetical protein VKI65_08360, partial [Gemmataceae bacterium]|nr:hypothetical protein [Gemmataceae bacterium]